MTTNFIHHLLQRNQGHFKQSKPWLQNSFSLNKPGETGVFFTSDRQSREGSTSTFNLVGKNRKIKEVSGQYGFHFVLIQGYDYCKFNYL